jgi:hypothetical protein
VWIVRPAMVHDVSAEDAEDEDSEREDIHAASWGNGPKAPGRTRTRMTALRHCLPPLSGCVSQLRHGGTTGWSGRQDLHLLAALSLAVASDFLARRIKRRAFGGSPAWTSEACPVNSGRGVTLLCSLSLAPLARTSLACVSYHAAARGMGGRLRFREYG